MKKLFAVISLVLAINFLAVAGGVGWLVSQKKLDKTSAMKIKDILFPKPAESSPTTQPTHPAELSPALKLDQLLAKKSGQTAAEQVEFIQQSFDTQMALLDRRQRELQDQESTLTAAKEQFSKDRQEFERQKQDLSDKTAEATKLANDRGFQDSLALYNTMPSKQVKTIFMGLDDATVQQYLETMEPRSAARIVKEFKTPDETARIQKVMERMRLNEAATTAAANASAATPK